jgi:DNA repair exonuclease SbcCD ATPase subunit
MNKPLSLLLAASIALWPVASQAQEINTPPIFVKPMLAEIHALSEDVINKQNQNRKMEEEVKGLARDNAALASQSMFADYTQFRQLRDLLNNYTEQITRRDELLAARDREIADLRERLNKANAVIAQMTAASQALANTEAFKATADIGQALTDKKEILTAQRGLLEGAASWKKNRANWRSLNPNWPSQKKNFHT